LSALLRILKKPKVSNSWKKRINSYKRRKIGGGADEIIIIIIINNLLQTYYSHITGTVKKHKSTKNG